MLWILQIVLAVAYAAHAAVHLLPGEGLRRQMEDQGIDGPRQAANIAELFGAVGLVVPGITGVAVWLTPAAAAGLATVMIGAVAFHARRREIDAVVFSGIFLVLTLAVFVGRVWLDPL